MQKTTTFLMFVGDKAGKAEEAIGFYVSLFKNSRVTNVEKWSPGENEKEGNVKQGRFVLDGQEYIAMDSTGPHKFTFTPAISIFVRCDNEKEIDEHFKKLSEGGGVLMPLQEYPFAKKFAWVNDKYGVSWQLFLAGN